MPDGLIVGVVAGRRRPRLLDLFCGAGGAARGYQLAGFEVVGVDVAPQPRYVGDHFCQADVIGVGVPALLRELGPFDAIHASPPCLPFTKAGFRWKQRTLGPDLLTPTRAALVAAGLQYVIENVPGSPVRAQVRLCGTHFNRPYIKHRYFECSAALTLPPMTCGHGRGGLRGAGLIDVFDADTVARVPWREAAVLLEVPWMECRRDVRNAIPPVYTEWIGRQLVAALALEVSRAGR